MNLTFHFQWTEFRQLKVFKHFDCVPATPRHSYSHPCTSPPLGVQMACQNPRRAVFRIIQKPSNIEYKSFRYEGRNKLQTRLCTVRLHHKKLAGLEKSTLGFLAFVCILWFFKVWDGPKSSDFCIIAEHMKTRIFANIVDH